MRSLQITGSSTGECSVVCGNENGFSFQEIAKFVLDGIWSALLFSRRKGRSCRAHVDSRSPKPVRIWPDTVSHRGPLGESAAQ